MLKKEGLERFYIIIIALAILFTSYQLHEIELNMSRSIINIIYNQTESTISNIANKTQNKPYQELDNYLPLLISKDVQRIFVLVYKNGVLYSVEDLPKHGYTYPKVFMPADNERDIILKAIKTKTPYTKYHDTIENVGFSLYYPLDVLINNKPYRALIVVDYKLTTLKSLKNTLEKTKLTILFINIISIVFLAIIVFLLLKTRAYKKESYLDELTGLPNRKLLKDIKNRQEQYIVAMLDIDFFKKINDTYSHDAGDIVLMEVSKTIKSSIREEDFVLRWGGEEFLILLKCKQEEHCLKTLERIRIKIKSLDLSIGNNIIKLTVSMGVCLKAKNLEEAVKKADEALYKAKRNGRDRIEVYDDKKAISL
ncbi:GGDEF domain-containing protein [Hydrogenobaculum acidophilum]